MSRSPFYFRPCKNHYSLFTEGRSKTETHFNAQYNLKSQVRLHENKLTQHKLKRFSRRNDFII